jgi:hypothetical protein
MNENIEDITNDCLFVICFVHRHPWSFQVIVIHANVIQFYGNKASVFLPKVCFREGR